MILIDANESRWDKQKNQYRIKWVRELDKMNYPFSKVDLSHNDGHAVVGPDVAIVGNKFNMIIERKDTKDFVQSVLNNKIFEQVHTGLSHVENAIPLLLIEGTWKRAFYKKDYLRPLATGAYASFLWKTKVKIAWTESASQTANLVKYLDMQSNDENNVDKIPKKIIYAARKPVDLRSIAYNMIMVMPGIAGNKALSIVQKMSEPKTLKRFFQSSKEELRRVCGNKLGDKFDKVLNLPLFSSEDAVQVSSPLFSLLKYLENDSNHNL